MARHISIKSAEWKDQTFHVSYRPRLFIQTQEGRRYRLELMPQRRHYVFSFIFTMADHDLDDYWYMLFCFTTARRILPGYVGQGISLADKDWNDMRPYYAERERKFQEWTKSLEANGHAHFD